MKVSENHKYRVGQRLTYREPGVATGICEVTVTKQCDDPYNAYSEPMYLVKRDDDKCDWPSVESRLSDPNQVG